MNYAPDAPGVGSVYVAYRPSAGYRCFFRFRKGKLVITGVYDMAILKAVLPDHREPSGVPLAPVEITSITYVVDGVEQTPVAVDATFDTASVQSGGDHSVAFYATDSGGRAGKLCDPFKWSVSVDPPGAGSLVAS